MAVEFNLLVNRNLYSIKITAFEPRFELILILIYQIKIKSAKETRSFQKLPILLVIKKLQRKYTSSLVAVMAKIIIFVEGLLF